MLDDRLSSFQTDFKVNGHTYRGSNSAIFIFTSPVRMYWKSYTSGIGFGGMGKDKM